MRIGDKVKVSNKVLMEYGEVGAIVEIMYTDLYPNGLADIVMKNDVSSIELEDLELI